MPKHQEVLRISLPAGVRLYPSRFRELLAKVPGLPNALFHRDDQGETINGKPPIRTVGGASWVGLVADPGEEELLRLAVGPAIMAVTKEVGSPCPVQVERREFGLEPADAPKPYFVREIVVKRGMVKEGADIPALIKARIEDSVETICANNGFDCPTREAMGIYVHEVTGVKGLRLQTTAGVTNRYVGLANARILINADLKGFWSVGSLTSRGYGRLIYAFPGMNTALEHKGGVLV